MFEALRDVQTSLARDTAVRVVVLRGDGPSFCSGLDLDAMAAGGFEPEPLLGRPAGEDANLAQVASYGWRSLAVPVVAAVHGACFGGGLQIALGADIRIVAPTAKVSVMEVKLGLSPDMAITQALPRLVREDIAKELSFTGRIVDGEKAAEVGLMTRVEVDPAAAAAALAAEIAGQSPQAVRAIKRLFAEGWGAPTAESLRLETSLARSLLGSSNQLEAVRAALAGEPPRFEDPDPAPSAGSEPPADRESVG